MADPIDTTLYTVEELIQLWQQGDLSVKNGEVQQPDPESLILRFNGQDGALFITYSLSEDLTSRSDESDRFNIMTAEPDVEQQPLPIRGK